MPLAERLVLSVGTDAAHARQAPEHNERDHRPHQDFRDSGLANEHATQLGKKSFREPTGLPGVTGSLNSTSGRPGLFGSAIRPSGSRSSFSIYGTTAPCLIATL